MNIFYIHDDPIQAAIELPDKLVVKMPLESAQMLSTAHRLLSSPNTNFPSNLYKASYISHPCNIWVRENTANYNWLYTHFQALSEEYARRYSGKVHKSYEELKEYLSTPPSNIPFSSTISLPALCMPEHCKIYSNPTLCYRYYISLEKSYAKWKDRDNPPSWYDRKQALITYLSNSI